MAGNSRPFIDDNGRGIGLLKRLGVDGTMEALRAAHPGVELAGIAGAGHMLHIERPESVAPVVEAFLDAH